jgi:hypothetical protein
MSETIQFIIVFFLMMFVDYCWGHYIKGLNDGNGLKAGFFWGSNNVVWGF